MTTSDNDIKTIIFDCFGVIADPILSFWYRDNYASRGFSDPDLLSVLRRFDLGQLAEDDVFERFSKYEGVTASKDEIKAQADQYTRLDGELVELIGALRSKGYETVLLTNAHHDYFERKIFVDFPQFKSLFDHLIISSRIGMAKPDREIYLHALQQTGKNPEQVIFIDDNRLNVEAAERIGIHGHVYSSVPSLIERLRELDVDAVSPTS